MGGLNIIHVLHSGSPLCGFSRALPGEWPTGHVWISLREFIQRSFADDALCGSCSGVAKPMWESFIGDHPSYTAARTEFRRDGEVKPPARSRVSFSGKDLDDIFRDFNVYQDQRRKFDALVDQARIVSVIAEAQGDCTLLVRTERLNVVSRELVEIDAGDRLLRWSDVVAALSQIGST